MKTRLHWLQTLLIFTLIPSIGFSQNFEKHGHRGARGNYPENTIPAFLFAIEQGVTTLELDVVISKDNKVIVSHDHWMSYKLCLDSLDRPIDSSSEKKHAIYKMNFDEVVLYNCGIKQKDSFPDQVSLPVHKPLLKDVIAICERYCREKKLPPVTYNIEIKSDITLENHFHPDVKNYVESVLTVLKDFNLADRIIIQSFDLRVLKCLHDKQINLKLSLLVDSKQEVMSVIHQLGFSPDYYSPNVNFVTADLIDQLHKKNIKIIPWTVNSASEIKRLNEMGVD